MIRAGLVGAGLHALTHVKGYQLADGIALNAVCDLDRDRTEQIAKEYGIPNVCANMAEMVSKGLVDLIDVVTPPLSHLELVREALSHGVHVLCEKPLALSVAECREMTDLAGDSAGRAFTVFPRRYDPLFMRVRELLQSGFVGKFLLGNGTVIANWGIQKKGWQAQGFRQWASDPATGGGFINGALPHYIDAMRYVLGDIDGVVSGSAPAEAPPPGRLPEDDTVVMVGKLRSSGMVTIAATWASRYNMEERWEFVGSDRTLVIEPDGRLYATSPSDREEIAVPLHAGIDAGEQPNQGFGFPNGGPALAALFTDLGRALVEAGPTHCATFEDGLRCTEIVTKLHEGRSSVN